MNYIRPKSDQARLAALETLKQKGVQDGQNGITYLHADTLAQIGPFTTDFAAAYTAVKTLDSTRMAAVLAANTAITSLTQLVRHVWSTVKWRKKLENQPASIYLFYGLPGSGRNPDIRSQAEWLVKADQIIQGEAEAIAAGYAPLAGPTIAELQVRATAARTAVSQRDAAKTAHDQAQRSLAALRQQADDLIAQAMGELRLALRQETPAHRREVMRGYGARFMPQGGETAVAEPAEPLTMETMTLLTAEPLAATNGTAVPV